MKDWGREGEQGRKNEGKWREGGGYGTASFPSPVKMERHSLTSRAPSLHPSTLPFLSSLPASLLIPFPLSRSHDQNGGGGAERKKSEERIFTENEKLPEMVRREREKNGVFTKDK